MWHLKPKFRKILSTLNEVLIIPKIFLFHSITKVVKLKRKNETLTERSKQLQRTANNHLGKQFRSVL